MALTATYESIMREKQEYDMENNIDMSNNPYMDAPTEGMMELPPSHSKAKSKSAPKKAAKKDVPLKPKSSLPEEPKPPLTAAGDISEVANSKEFIKEFAPTVEYHAQRLGLSPDLMLAQIALETGWGKSAPGYNYGGQKVGANYKGKSQTFNTKEFISGFGMKDVKGEQFRAYDSPAEGIKGYFDFFKSYDRYKPVFGIADPNKGADMMQKVGYATDPKYSAKLKNIIKTVQRLRKENNV